MEHLHTACRLSAGQKVYMAIKSSLDFIISLLALMVLALPMVILALIIKLDDRGPVFFKQKRIGKDQKHFMMLKFRTMRTDTPKDTATHLLTDPQKYITKVGRFLRKTSLDELPQLINIIKGDMSIIGPRPPLIREVAEYNEYQLHRLDVKTGLSCYHECYGRSKVTDFDEWVEADLKYIRERSMLTDLKIIFLTIKVVLTGEGAC